MRKVSLVAPPPSMPAENRFTPPTYAEAQEAQKLVTITGPLADYMAQHPGSSQSPEAKPQAESQVETLEAAPAQPVASDHVGGSVVGSNLRILNRTFRVRSTVQVTFEVPAHAATPRLRGSYESFFRQAGGQDTGTDAEIECLVLNEQQFTDFMNKRAGEATFSAEDAHAQEVNTSLPPTLNQPEKYHLIFRNNSHGPETKFVKADFRMDF